MANEKHDGGLVNVLELRDTIDLMNSADYKDRFAAEYWQTKIRYKKLRKMLIKSEADKLEFTPRCPIYVLEDQAHTMEVYLRHLEVRAEIEEIDLDGYKTIMEQMRSEGSCVCTAEGES